MFSPEVKNTFASRRQLLRPKHMFPSLATIKTMLISFQYCWLIKKRRANSVTIPAEDPLSAPVLPSQSVPIWTFLYDLFTFVGQTGYYHTQSSYLFFRFDADAFF